MKSLSQSVTSILASVTPLAEEPHTPAHGSTPQGDAATRTATTALTIFPTSRPLPASPEDLRTTHSVLASMQRQGRLIFSSVTRESRSPKLDHNGKIYGWEYDLEETGEFEAKITGATDEDRAALAEAIRPGHKRGIQQALEHLAQIKPIGASETKQSTVISYLTYDLHQDGVSEYVVTELCSEFRKSMAHTFFPDYGVFYNAATERMKKYRTAWLRVEAQTARGRA